MLSRVADSIYWLGRYVERAENYARFIDVNLNLLLDLPPGLNEQWEPLVTVTGDKDWYTSKYNNFSRDNVVFFMTFDEENPNSIISSISRARENARIIRENLARESWEKLNELYYIVKNAKKKKVWLKNDPRVFFEQIKYGIQLIYGIADNSVSRTEGWYFSQIGQFLERADKTSRILDVKYHILLPSLEEVGSTLDFLHWAALLKSVGGFNTYRRFYGGIEPAGVLEFLALDQYFPRSILFCLRQAEKGLHCVSGSQESGYSNVAEKKLGALRSELEFADVNDVMDFGLHEFMDSIQIKINNISDEIHNRFFKITDNFTGIQSLQE
ncbi:alpha-E domain-containing protein [Fulvivirga sp. M361]|uniref:alpha-E domain-containing protein n=1 Tax=Fulvivirga sp. M361 TaxID=2594266 RepID=UPI00117AA07E|nr:alpha-E domain-containing protein [Fulvivirga sp. M361]TRX49198.1 alpha-E domain-containing protein [Fulvivirga sp. M361]